MREIASPVPSAHPMIRQMVGSVETVAGNVSFQCNNRWNRIACVDPARPLSYSGGPKRDASRATPAGSEFHARRCLHAMTNNVVVIIPARYGSTRLPGKALAPIAGVPMIVRVYEAARTIPDVDGVYVATDDTRIADAVERVGGRTVLTRADHESGTDRVAEAVERLPADQADIVVNVQGDMPFLEPEMIVPMVRRLRDDPDLPMATVMTPIHDAAQWADPNVVKVVADRHGNALYFSRQAIPSGGSVGDENAADAAVAMHHIGLYAYRRSFLSRFARLDPTPLERAERLEQLRALEYGYRIGVATWSGAPVLEVNGPADLELACDRGGAG